ncbi:hypothetical protein R4172_01795 [Rhodococcus kroppenstedtii]|uniref:Uncharacterized protein n=1 Tax=Rhodococcoides kroppenstedtii TaxID=293050 RepID=A0A1I0TIT2_9NOCA|nr:MULTISPECIES: hypothetical protein [Rhodococcus]AMY17681.1 hypothetical protein A3Q40_00267 [Rhodococcus sp. PBTS 1]MDV7196292.1 hypothetical protein [Rhodococcus kroppenstedtii]SFA51708.1 hypothetical protein SAMN05444374_10715 [Rhodococcus kroppenstedtii]
MAQLEYGREPGERRRWAAEIFALLLLSSAVVVVILVVASGFSAA